jgi:hypothetical protein
MSPPYSRQFAPPNTGVSDSQVDSVPVYQSAVLQTRDLTTHPLKAMGHASRRSGLLLCGNLGRQKMSVSRGSHFGTRMLAPFTALQRPQVVAVARVANLDNAYAQKAFAGIAVALLSYDASK